MPVWIDVEIRLPSAPKMLPRSPIAAGIMTSSPGSISKVSVMEPRTAPATRLVHESNTSAVRLWRTASPVGPSRSTRRRPSSSGCGRRLRNRLAMACRELSGRTGRRIGPGHPTGQPERRRNLSRTVPASSSSFAGVAGRNDGSFPTGWHACWPVADRCARWSSTAASGRSRGRSPHRPDRPHD